MKFSPAFLTLSTALLLWCGCSQNPQVAGGDDYPNSANSLGKHSAQERSDTSEWNAYRDAPTNPPGLYDSTQVPDSVPQFEPATATDTFALSASSDSTRFLIVHIHHVDSLRSVDSTFYQPDVANPLKPLIIRVSGFVRHANGTEYRYLFQDGDADGFLSPRLQSSIASVSLVTQYPSGETRETNLRLGAGVDLKFNGHGNGRLLTMEQTDRNGSDTLSYLKLQDADGDGTIFDSTTSSNRVDVQQETWNSGAVKTTLLYRIAAFPNATQNYPLRFHRIVESGGAVEETWALGRDSLPDFVANDSGWVKTISTFPSTDSLSQSSSLYSVLLASAPGHFSADHLLSVDHIQQYRYGDASQFRFHLQPDSVISDGNFLTTGSLTARLDFTSGKWIQINGVITASEISGLATDSQGGQRTLHFDLRGTLKSSSGF